VFVATLVYCRGQRWGGHQIRPTCGLRARTSRLIASVRPSRSVCCPAWCWEARLLRRCRRGLVCPTRRQSPVGRTARIRRPASQHTRLPVAAPRRRRRPICRRPCLSNAPDLDAGLRCEEIHTVHRGSASRDVRKVLACKLSRSVYWRSGRIRNLRYSSA
jgi:hypothetical protein